MTIALPTPVNPTVVRDVPPNPYFPNNTPNIPPANTAIGLPTQQSLAVTILQALAQGTISPNIQVSTYTAPGAAAVSFATYLNPTLASLLNSGAIPGNAAVGTLAYAAQANYGGN